MVKVEEEEERGAEVEEEKNKQTEKGTIESSRN